MDENKKKSVKEQTLDLYAQLPQDEEERKKKETMYLYDIANKLPGFLEERGFDPQPSGYIASHTFINNISVTYEDKLQSALCHFCECWWWYKYEKKYRTDLSFAVFFKLRIVEVCVEAILRHKHIVVSLLDDITIFHH